MADLPGIYYIDSDGNPQMKPEYASLFHTGTDSDNNPTTIGPSNQDFYDKYVHPEDKSIGGYETTHGMDEGGLNIYGGGGIQAGTRAPGLTPEGRKALGLPELKPGQSDFGSFTGVGNHNAAG